MFLLSVWILAPCFFENVFLGYVDTFNGRNIVFDSLVKFKWRVYCQKSRLYFSEDNILHGPASTIHWTFPVAFLVVKPTQLEPFEKTVCQKTEDKTGSELGRAAILQTTTLVYFTALTLSTSSVTFFKHHKAAIRL